MSNLAFLAVALMVALFAIGLVMCVLLCTKILDTDKEQD